MKNLIRPLIPNFLLNSFRAYKKNQYLKSVKGHNVECSICNATFKVFGDYGHPPRTNANCYNCGSKERHRLLFKYLKDQVKLFEIREPISILHFAPEGFFYEILSNSPHIQYTPCDLQPELYNFDGTVEVQKVDITNIPYEDGSFDFILCNHVLEHIPEDRVAMKELFRVMKEGGHGIFQVPIDYNLDETFEDWSITSPEERAKAFGQHDHVRWYGNDYKKRLAAAGFEVDENTYVKKFSSDEQFKYGFSPDELIYHCKKSLTND